MNELVGNLQVLEQTGVACKCTRGRLQSSWMSCSRCMHNLIYACHTPA